MKKLNKAMSVAVAAAMMVSLGACGNSTDAAKDGTQSAGASGKVYNIGKDNTPTGTVNFYLCTRKGDPENPDWSRVVNDWYPVDLSALGVVDKIVFDLESTDIEAGTGRMRTPAYFCLDGIRIQE